jgi:methyltransferase (TIGR00027 family)
VVLGAGLDTFAYRNPFKDRLRVFEVDHPATQIWKRRRLADTGIPIPESLVYVPVDFERESLSARLLEAGLDPEQRTFFIWLGVTPYLTKGAIVATLEQIAALPGGSEVAFDYGEPRDRIDPAHRPAHDALSARVAAVGEPFLSSFVPEDLHATLRAMGFDKIEDLDVPGIRQRLFSAPDGSPAEAGTNASPRAGGHLLFASKGAARPAGRGA